MTTTNITAITLAVAEGLRYIMGHFKGQLQYFPRTISTKATHGRQVVVDDLGETMDRYLDANFMDCRISAYPPNV
jgi:hypothetical protein